MPEQSGSCSAFERWLAKPSTLGERRVPKPTAAPGSQQTSRSPCQLQAEAESRASHAALGREDVECQMGNCCAGDSPAAARPDSGQRVGGQSAEASREERAAMIAARLEQGNGGISASRAAAVADERLRTELIGKCEAHYRTLGEQPPIGLRSLQLDKARRLEAKLAARIKDRRS